MKVLSAILAALMLHMTVGQTLLLAQEQPKTRVAVIDFEGQGITPEEAATLTERFRSTLIDTDKFIIVERQKVNMILDELGLQMTGMVSEESLSEAGKMLGVQRMVTGTIGKIEETYTVDLRVVEVETGKMLGSINRNTSGTKENLIALLERMAKLMAGIQVEVEMYKLRILSVPGSGSIYIDGKYVGLSPLDTELEKGVHDVRISLDGYKPWTGKVSLDKEEKVVARMEKAQSKMKTWLWIGAGTLVAGGGILAAVMLAGDEGNKDTRTPIGTPPDPPSN